MSKVVPEGNDNNVGDKRHIRWWHLPATFAGIAISICLIVLVVTQSPAPLLGVQVVTVCATIVAAIKGVTLRRGT